jgi:hypothetical protein
VAGRVGTLLSAWADVTNSVVAKIATEDARIFMVLSRVEVSSTLGVGRQD